MDSVVPSPAKSTLMVTTILEQLRIPPDGLLQTGVIDVLCEIDVVGKPDADE